jgi:hypothetical protein
MDEMHRYYGYSDWGGGGGRAGVWGCNPQDDRGFGGGTPMDEWGQ